jgi:hypothetical protein
MLASAALSVCLLASARADDRVAITGGSDGSGQNYQWTIVNQHSSPIISVEFPHYQADTFFTPPGWKQECTHLAIANSENLPGVCRGWADGSTQEIGPGQRGTFGMRLARISAQKGSGTVTVKFADGSTAQVPGVVLPVLPSVWERFLVPIAMGGLFLAAFLIHARRKRRADRAKPSAPGEST